MSNTLINGRLVKRLRRLPTPQSLGLERDVEFTTRHGVLYKVLKIRENGEINAWGPLRADGKSPYGKTVTFVLGDVKEVFGKRPKWKE